MLPPSSTWQVPLYHRGSVSHCTGSHTATLYVPVVHTLPVAVVHCTTATGAMLCVGRGEETLPLMLGVIEYLPRKRRTSTASGGVF